MSKITINLNQQDAIKQHILSGSKRELHIYFPNESKRLETIASGRIWSSNPLKFNDPFERDVVIDAIRLSIAENPLKLIQAYVESGPKSSGTSKFLVSDELIELMNGHLSSSTGKFINPSDFRSDFKTYLTNELSHYGVTCFSKRPDNELMWAYYAAGHRGFVVTFEYSEVAFGLARKNLAPGKMPYMLQEVDYRSLRPQVDLWKILFTNCIKDLFATKSLNWSHEKEVRLINRFETRFEDENGFELPIPDGFRIKSITAGAKTSRQMLKKIQQTADELSNAVNGDVSVIMQHLSKTTYKMDYMPAEQ